MYRTIIPAVFTLAAVSVTAAPQDGSNSDITYVKIQPVTSGTPSGSPYRESRIENLPLTIPGNVARSSKEKDTGQNDGDRVSQASPKSSGPVIKQFVYDGDEFVSTSKLTQERNDSQRKTRSEESTESNESDTIETTTQYEETTQTEVYEARTKAPSPRFISKLSYFQKNDDPRSSIATNLVERTGKRKFRSKCRCEKIWNCPKLQITVPRCPNEYFMCCF